MRSSSETDPKAQAKILDRYGKLPLTFEANRGQADASVKFLTRAAGYTLFLTGDEAVLELSEKGMSPAAKVASNSAEPALSLRCCPKRSSTGKDAVPFPESVSATGPHARSTDENTASVLRIKLRNANPTARVTGMNTLAGTVNYFIGRDPAKWRTSVPTYAKVKYEGIYPGIDLVYHGNQQDLEYDFVLHPGADARVIRLGIEGAKSLRLDHGELVLSNAAGDIHLRQLQIYQQANGRRQSVAGRFVMKGSNEVGFEIGSYDRRRSLVIDPVLAYSTYLEGSSIDVGTGIAVDAAGNAYVTGVTYSTDFPRANPLQPTNHGDRDAFITKMNAEGTGLIYSTYLGGSGFDDNSGIAVDSVGNAYITGGTSSTDFPTVNPLQPTNHAGSGGENAFVTKINAEGTALVYSTYLGGSISDWGSGIAVDSNGRAYVVGSTGSPDFPIAHAVQPAFGGGDVDAFVTKINASGSALIYSTYLGGSDVEYGRGIAVDSAGNAYVTGSTHSTDFPTANPFQPANRFIDAFVTKINATGSTLVYSTYLGGNGVDGGAGIAVDATGHAYVTGTTTSSDFPTKNALQNSGVVFVTKMNAQGNALVYSTYLDGVQGAGIAVDSTGNAYIVGSTQYAPFVREISATGSALVYSIDLGFSGTGSSVAVDSAGSAYMTGNTRSLAHVATLLAFQKSLIGNWTFKAFVSKIAAETFVSTSKPMLNFLRQIIGTTSAPKRITLTNQGPAALTIKKIYVAGRNASDFAQTNNCGASLLAGASCAISVTFGPSGIGDRKGVLGISDSDPASPQALALSGPGTAVSLSTTLLAFGNQPVGTTSAPMHATLTNVASTPLNFTDISVGGTDPDDFQQTNTCGTSIAGGATCTVTVTFTPTMIGKRTAVVSISDNGGGSPQKITLRGTGT